MNKNKLILNIFLILVLILSSSLMSFGATANDVFSGGFLSAKSLKYTMENYSMPTTEAKNAIAQWNGVSGQVKITNSNVSNAHIKLSIGRLSPPTSGDLGLTKLMTTNDVQVSTSQRWTHALCIRYNSPYLDTTAKKTATLTHEVGHALSMAHCTSASHSFIMQQGVKVSYALVSHDKEKLKYKWGS